MFYKRTSSLRGCGIEEAACGMRNSESACRGNSVAIAQITLLTAFSNNALNHHALFPPRQHDYAESILLGFGVENVAAQLEECRADHHQREIFILLVQCTLTRMHNNHCCRAAVSECVHEAAGMADLDAHLSSPFCYESSWTCWATNYTLSSNISLHNKTCTSCMDICVLCGERYGDAAGVMNACLLHGR